MSVLKSSVDPSSIDVAWTAENRFIRVAWTSPATGWTDAILLDADGAAALAGGIHRLFTELAINLGSPVHVLPDGGRIEIGALPDGRHRTEVIRDADARFDAIKASLGTGAGPCVAAWNVDDIKPVEGDA